MTQATNVREGRTDGRRLPVFVGSLNREAPYFQGARGMGLSAYALDEATWRQRTARRDHDHRQSDLPVGDRRRDAPLCQLRGLRLARGHGDGLPLRPRRAGAPLHQRAADPRQRSRRTIASPATGVSCSSRTTAWARADPTSRWRVRHPRGRRADGAGREHRPSRRDRPERGATGAHATPTASPRRSAAASPLSPISASTACSRIGIGPTARSSHCRRPRLTPGAGPRHVALHPNGRFVFVMNELDSTVASLALDPRPAPGAFSTPSPRCRPRRATRNHCADIQISPDGRFVYGSNRGHDSIPIFAVDQDSGKLTLVDYTPCGGSTPRNLALITVRRAPVLGQPERRPRHHLRARCGDRPADRHRQGDRDRHADVRPGGEDRLSRSAVAAGIVEAVGPPGIVVEERRPVRRATGPRRSP